MKRPDPEDVARAAARVAARNRSIVTDVVENRSYGWDDRIAAAAAMTIVAGILCFIVWLGILYVLARGDGASDVPWFFPSWRWPAAATLALAGFTFFSPGWGIHYFGRMKRAFEFLLTLFLVP